MPPAYGFIQYGGTDMQDVLMSNGLRQVPLRCWSRYAPQETDALHDRWYTDESYLRILGSWQQRQSRSAP